MNVFIFTILVMAKLFAIFGAIAAADDLQSQLQQALDQVVAGHLGTFPNLSLSFAWKDGSQEVAVASGVVLGRSATQEDTFLYGSGTKPVTASSVMSLIDQGLVKGDDKAYTILDPYFAEMGQPSMADIFGEGIKNATVLSLIRMSAGIRDFEDDYTFDQEVLSNGTKFWDNYPFDAMEFSVSDLNVKAGGFDGPLICPAGGNCTSYSSTSYDVAGLLLTAVLQSQSSWVDFDLGNVLFKGHRSEVPSMQFPTGGSKISDFLTVPGYSVDPSFSADPVTIYEQDASILGFTCGNMVSRPTDVARFWYRLFDEEHADLISKESQEEMKSTQTLTRGWAAGYLHYGAGIQDRQYGGRNTHLDVKGHEGATYAFLSASGYVSELKGSFSMVGNTDVGGLPITVACPMLEIVKRAVTGNATFSLGCRNVLDAEVVV